MPHDASGPGSLPVDPDLGGTDRRWDLVLVIAAGGALGGGARWLLNDRWPAARGAFPWSTFTENVVGCLLLGAVMVWLLEVRAPGRYARPFLAVGVLGGFTTFSTYTADTASLVGADASVLALVYLVGTLGAALAATWVGLTLARRLARRHPGAVG